MKTTKKGIFSFAFVAEFIHFKKEVLPALQTILHRIGPLISIFAHSSAHTKPHFRNLYGLKKFSSLNTQSTKGDFFLELPLPLPHWASQGGYSLAHMKTNFLFLIYTHTSSVYSRFNPLWNIIINCLLILIHE